MKLPLRHISVRVPWHDNAWNGQICKDPRNNASCMFLPRVQTKDVEYEEQHKGTFFHQLTGAAAQMPPCIAEKVTFLSPHEVTKSVEHPYAQSQELYKHYKPTPLKYPKYSFSVVPYGWMLKDKTTKANTMAESLGLAYDAEKEPALGFADQWVQHYDNQKCLLDAFSSALRPHESLVFIYAKNIPLVDNVDRILVGVTTVTSVGQLTEYSYNTARPPMRSLLWERPIFHGLKGEQPEGFILPYHDILPLLADKPFEEVEPYIAYAPNFEEFSYGSELVSHDAAIDALIALRNALVACAALLRKENEYRYQLDWLNNQLGKLWDMRGAYPGLGAVLSALTLPEGNVVAMEVENYTRDLDGEVPVTDPWTVVEDVLTGHATWLRKELRSKIGVTYGAVWNTLSPGRKQYIKLLSRLAINNEQAKFFIERDDETRFIKNMYLFFEESIGCLEPVRFETVDKALFLKPALLETFPLPEESAMKGPIDERRVRALVMDVLEKAAAQGHSLQTIEQVITAIESLSLEHPVHLTRDILHYAEQFFMEEEEARIDVIMPTNESPNKFYKLSRLSKLRNVIANFVATRVHKARRVKLPISWEEKIASSFGEIPASWPQWLKDKEARARAEKAATLTEITQSRFTVVVGPAGTGKTTLLNLFCEESSIANQGILKLAPTGKARVKLGAGAQTIAQFLSGYDRYDGSTGHYFLNPEGRQYSQSRTVIIDEASMLTENQLAAVIDTLVDVDRFILVGDPRQLPPIGTGKPFVDIIQFLQPALTGSGGVTIAKGFAELKEIFRQKVSEIDMEAGQEEERNDVRLSRWFSDSPIRKDDVDIFDEIAMHPTKDWKSLKLVSWFGVKDLQDALLRELEAEHAKGKESQVLFEESLGGVELKNKTNLPAYFNRDAAKAIENWQILTPLNNNGFGSKELNRLIQSIFRKKHLELALNPPKLAVWEKWQPSPMRIPPPVGTDNIVYGDKVINLKNTRWNKKWQKIDPYSMRDEALQYFANGEIGIVNNEFWSDYNLLKDLRQKKNFWKYKWDLDVHVTFSSQPDYSYVFATNDFDAGDNDRNKVRFELAYAITVHKSQGSGFKTVFLVLPNPCTLLSRELLYTALTRQEDRIIIFHQGDFKDYKKFTSDSFSETGRRLTDLFGSPTLKQVNKRSYDSRYVQVSAKGEFMISKSEVIIADHLFREDVPYTYEQPVTDTRGITIHPDFTISNSNLGVTFYWEHLGMLSNEQYRTKWARKQEWYRLAGIVPLEQATQDDDKILITTKDKPDGGIDSQEVLQLIREHIKG